MKLNIPYIFVDEKNLSEFENFTKRSWLSQKFTSILHLSNHYIRIFMIESKIISRLPLSNREHPRLLPGSSRLSLSCLLPGRSRLSKKLFQDYFYLIVNILIINREHFCLLPRYSKLIKNYFKIVFTQSLISL